MRRPLLAFVCLLYLLIICLPCHAQTEKLSQQDVWNKGPLISCDALERKLRAPELVLLDLGPERELYEKGHLPGALFVDWVDDITDPDQPDRYQLIGKAAMQKLLRKLGIKKESRVVIYDDLNSRISIRMYWSLKYYGITRVQLLDGGRTAWLASDRPLEQKSRTPVPSEIVIQSGNDKIAANLDFIADRLQNPNVSLIDGRPADQFSGNRPGKVFHTGALHQRKGHIPGAVNIFWKDNFNADGTFKSASELQKLYQSVTGSDQIVTYCNEGLHATPPWFVLSEILGHGDVRVYDSSLSEWANTDQPLETSPAKVPDQ
ncbi:MAG: sulfurtransferase [Pirellulaceae bacterium]|nr:sulfurtransferase [Pirellulaceae bacterium]